MTSRPQAEAKFVISVLYFLSKYMTLMYLLHYTTSGICEVFDHTTHDIHRMQHGYITTS